MAGLAGCTDGDAGDPDSTPTEAPPDVEPSEGPAEFAVYDAAWLDADDVTVDGEGKVELLIGNRGGEPGQFSGALVAESMESTSADLLTGDVSTIDGEIESGEAVTVTSETVSPGYAGRYEATIGDGNGNRLSVAEDANAELLVTPHSGAGDETLPLVGDLRMYVESVQFEQGLHHDTKVATFFGSKDRVGLLSTLPDQTFVLVNAVVENAGNSGATVDAESFQLAGENALATTAKFYGIDRGPLHAVNVNPGSRVEGRLLFRLDRDVVADVNLQAYRDSRSAAADTVWELETGDVDFPTFELESMDVPDEYDHDIPHQDLSFTVRNAGDGVGTFRGALEWREKGESGWEELQPGNEALAARIPPGETATVSSHTNHTGDTSFEFRFIPFGATFLIE